MNIQFATYLMESHKRLTESADFDELYALRHIARQRKYLYLGQPAEFCLYLIEYDEEVLADARDMRATADDVDALIRAELYSH